MSNIIGFGIVIGLEAKIPEQEFPPATVFFRNTIVVAPKGHEGAIRGKWVNMYVREDMDGIVQVFIMDVLSVEPVITRFFCRTDFEFETAFAIVDDQTVFDMFCGYATIVPEDREFLAERRGYVYGIARPADNWALWFELKDPPDGFNLAKMNAIYDPDAEIEYSDDSEEDSSDASPENASEQLNEGSPEETVPCRPADFLPDVNDAAAFMFSEDQISSGSVISSMSNISISKTSTQSVSPIGEMNVCSDDLAVFKGYDDEDVERHPLLGLPYRKNVTPQPMPKPVFDIPKDDDEDDEYAEFDRFNRRAMAEINRRPTSEEFLRSRDEQPIPLILPEETEFEDPDVIKKRRSEAEEESKRLFFRSPDRVIPLTLPPETEFEPDSDNKTETVNLKGTTSPEAEMVDSNGSGSRETEMRFTKRRFQPEVQVKEPSPPPRNDNWLTNAYTANRSTNGYGPLFYEPDSNRYGARESYSKKPKHVNPYDLYDAMVARNSSTTTSSSQHTDASASLPRPPRFTQRRTEEPSTRAYGEPMSKRWYGPSMPNHPPSSTESADEPIPHKPATVEVPKSPPTPPPDSSNTLQPSELPATVRPPKVKRYVFTKSGMTSAPRRRFVIVHPPASTPSLAPRDAPSPSSSQENKQSPPPSQKSQKLTKSRSTLVGDHGFFL